MDNIQRWYNEVKNITRIFEVNDDEFIIYKGFKITSPLEGDPFIEDVRFGNIYSNITQQDCDTFKTLGFIQGADTIGNTRDIQRVESYRKRTRTLYQKRKKFRKELPKDKRLNEKRIRNINIKIAEFVDLIFFYETKVKQFNNKYNVTEN